MRDLKLLSFMKSEISLIFFRMQDSQNNSSKYACLVFFQPSPHLFQSPRLLVLRKIYSLSSIPTPKYSVRQRH